MGIPLNSENRKSRQPLEKDSSDRFQITFKSTGFIPTTLRFHEIRHGLRTDFISERCGPDETMLQDSGASCKIGIGS